MRNIFFVKNFFGNLRNRVSTFDNKRALYRTVQSGSCLRRSPKLPSLKGEASIEHNSLRAPYRTVRAILGRPPIRQAQGWH